MKPTRSVIFLALVAAMVLAPALGLLVRALQPSSLDGLLETSLSGVTNPAPVPQVDLRSFLNSGTQSALEPWLVEKMGRPREIYLRLKNGFDYVLGRSDVISIGRSRFLNGKSYVSEWCLRADRKQTEGVVAPLVAAVISIQQTLQARHKPFVFMISPSKAAVMPEYLPSWCAAADRPRPYDLLLAELKSANIPVIDGHDIALRTKVTGGWLPFGRDGAHWNDIGQFDAVHALVTELERQLGRPIGNVTISDVRIDRTPIGAEADAGLIANLPFSLKPLSPHASFDVADHQSTPSGLFVGTSFSWGPLQIMMGQRLFADSKFYYYFSSIYAYRPGAVVGQLEDAKAEADLARFLDRADFVVLEANEAELAIGHIGRFAAAIEALPQPSR
jgi:alginate O-acetyltransferase complex protein AlgJ